ncbi:hypothetical protein LA635_3233 [Erwinia amylovora LA635]|uniref:Uncharacterized protein n=2 Tax=Erwinia amylovora TaxID=552 RepID=D4I3T7_ERWAC|nr:hypothetical protein predicted by Glimmer/Critica [Erwinia amylovora CFBP1430]CBX82463.1 hypothetical protein predicted by Glimmer/Critica [Erwinia amylovora ATCC BAA-2158]CDK16857.1 hypothetical protein LA635_3233 [Erwinia amylovora LA635]CDK20225.1 hypothetical protein LA636_3233 [Erwinia amylovora LA636]CDK23596.1 hypothetical protein LA637_3236 [Erwinia amylovora LA637]
MIPLATGDGVPDLKQLLPPVLYPPGQPIFF